MAHSLKARTSILLLVFAAGSLQALAQSGRMRGQSAPRNQSEPDSVRLRVEEVLLPIRVRGDYGKLTAPLRRSDLIVTEDGKRRQVNDVISTPANVLFILDAGGERTIKHTSAHRDLAEMISSMAEGDRRLTLTYADKCGLCSSWTAEQERLCGTRFRLASSPASLAVYAACCTRRTSCCREWPPSPQRRNNRDG